MFQKILIANRAEIACRIIRTAKRLGIIAVGIYSEIDRNALHVKMADESILLPGDVKTNYLNMEAIIQAAIESRAQAIHPGYGYLSENAEFAEKVTKAGLVFIGPTSESIRKMGSKSQAKLLMQQVGIPVIPGFHEQTKDYGKLIEAAHSIGFPLLIKASGGGGGKGMRLVNQGAAFKDALSSCQREALLHFKDETIILEKYITHPRHIEVQIFGDAFGNYVHLFERDCSIQRRHQKIIEESRAPNLPLSLLTALCETAVQVAKSIQYKGAGTVEFLLDENQQYYFMEMNTRLQVEHPVTEMITGLDLVEWQLRVAANEPLPLIQETLDKNVHGHAIEARLYAEDPEQDFLPATGQILALSLPPTNPSLRIDTGIEPQDFITIYYDPLLAKIIAYGANRTEAISTLQSALENLHLVGVTSNLFFLQKILQHPAFQQAKIDTGFIEKNQKELIKPNIVSTLVLQAVSVYLCLKRHQKMKHMAGSSNEFNSPWLKPNRFRLNYESPERLHLRCQNQSFITEVMIVDEENFIVFCDQNNRTEGVNVSLKLAPFPNKTGSTENTGFEELILFVGNTKSERYNFLCFQLESLYYLAFENQSFSFKVEQQGKDLLTTAHAGGQLTAPMPGIITKILVNVGSKVSAGDPILSLEAMKMEHTITAPASGKVTHLFYAVGDTVEADAELLSLTVFD